MKLESSTLVAAPPQDIYDLLADYRNGHPRIVPRRYFQSLDVLEGGIGAGAVIECRLRLLGKTHTFRAAVTEPEPGRVLAETDLDTGVTTTFTIEADPGGKTRVTIATGFGAPSGMLERLKWRLVRMALRRVYREELELIRAVCEKRDRTD